MTKMETAQQQAPNIDALASQLMAEFSEAQRSRAMVNERWLEDLRQYRGIYAGDVSKRLKKNKSSRAFYRLTTAKVNTMTARLMDLLFPQRTKNWSISPTPDPMLPDDVVMDALKDVIDPAAQQIMAEMVQRLQAQNVIPDAWTMQNIQAEAYNQAFAQADTEPARITIAQDRAKSMENVIDDQLKECNANGQRRPSWRQNCRSIVKSSCLYGMGVLKGPLIERVVTKRFVPTKDASGDVSWKEQEYSKDLRPYHEAVSIWEIYPDPGARLPAELRYVWQIHTMADKDLSDLKNFPGFDAELIKDHMAANEDGDAQLSDWEVQVRELNDDNISNGQPLKKRFRVYERWGFLSGKDLASAGVEIAAEDMTKIYSSCVWILGNSIIKASVNPLEGVDIPYHFYPYQDDDSSFWPEGIAYQLRTPQSGINAAVRAMQDNAGASSGPIYGINTQALDDTQSVDEMRANKLFLFAKSGINLSQAFQAVTVPSAIEHNMTLQNFWQQVGDEVSTPRFNQGDGNIAGAGKTASGLSMLMGASNILLKDHVKDFDDFVVAPFIRAMFRWNMQWNPREDIKGDFEVVASGSQSLIAKEVRAQQVPALIGYLGIPAFEPYLKAKELLEVALEQTDLPAERLLRSDDEAKQYQQQMMLDQAKAQAQAQASALVEQLERQGLPPEQIQQQLLMLLSKTVPATMGPGAQQPGAGMPPQGAMQ